MLSRGAFAVAAVLATTSSLSFAEPMSPDTARRFVVGKVFAYNCFDGTRGTGRIYDDGSVAGSIQIRGGPMRYLSLPAGTLKVKGAAVCATVRGMPFEPCFNLNRMDDKSFRGSVSGLGFAYCDFTRRTPTALRTTWRGPAKKQEPVHAAAIAPAAGE
jgi:hypothetical protein